MCPERIHIRNVEDQPAPPRHTATFSVAVAVGYIALFGIAVETGVDMIVYLHEALEHKLQSGTVLTNADVESAAIEGAAQRLRQNS